MSDLFNATHFPALDHGLFLDHAAVGPLTGPAVQTLHDYAQHASTLGYATAPFYRAIHRVKANLAKLINARGPHEIALMPNTSTGLATVAESLPLQPGDRVLTTGIEYPANRYPWQHLTRKGVGFATAEPDENGIIDADDLAHAIDDDTRCVAVSAVQFGTGQRIDLKRVADEVHQVGGHLCVDGIQALGVLPMDVQAMGIDFMAADSHKWLLGPEGAGFLYVHEDLIPQMTPPTVGWMNMVNADDYSTYDFTFQPDARRFEPGTWNIAGSLAMGASVELLMDIGIDMIWQRVDALNDHLCAGLRERGWPVYSSRLPHERSGIVSFTLPDRDHATVRKQLLEHGITIANRAGRLRVSPHAYNTTEHIDTLLQHLDRCG